MGNREWKASLENEGKRNREEEKDSRTNDVRSPLAINKQTKTPTFEHRHQTTQKAQIVGGESEKNRRQ